ncbi:MAG TPA: BNR-4 repeat-containing protein [Acidimicrobiales bacterium]
MARALAALALGGVLAACLPAGAEQVPYRMDASNQAGWWKPLDEFGGSVYVAYDAWGSAKEGGSADRHTVYVARRTASGAWSRGCLRAAGGGCAVFTDDIGHRQPTLAIDGDGYIHVFAGMHGNRWIYHRSARPGDPTTMVDRSAQMPDQGGVFTYPNATRTPNGDIYLIIRDGRHGRLYRWNDAADAWSRAATFASQTDHVVYPDDIVPDAAGDLHIAWEWSYGGANGLRHLGSYARYEPATGRFFDAAGRELAAPIGTSSTAVYQPLVAGERQTDRGGPGNPPGFQTAKLTIDPATGRPLAAYRMRVTAGGRFQVRLAQWDGTAWRRQIVYAGTYTTCAAVDVTIHSGRPPGLLRQDQRAQRPPGVRRGPPAGRPVGGGPAAAARRAGRAARRRPAGGRRLGVFGGAGPAGPVPAADLPGVTGRGRAGRRRLLSSPAHGGGKGDFRP